MISAETVLNIIQENNIEVLKNVIPDVAYNLIVKKYIKNNDKIPYLKKLIKKYENKEKKNMKINQKYLLN